MGRKAVSTATVVLLVIVAGCAGFTSGSDSAPKPTVTPTATATVTPTATATETPTSGVTMLPAGWSPTGVENASVALDAHYRAVLTGPSVTVYYQSRVLESEGPEPRNTTLDMNVDTEAKRIYASLDGKTEHREAFFANGTLTQWSVRNETVVSRSDAGFDQVGQSIDRNVLLSHLLLYELELNRTVERAGTTAFVYDVTGVHRNTVSRWGSGVSGSGHVVVTARGRMLELETTVAYENGRITYRYTHTRLGETTVERPDWAQNES